MKSINDELREICRSTAEELGAHASGSLKRCDDCGEWVEPVDGEAFDECPNCGCDLDDADESSVYSYLEREVYSERVELDLCGSSPTLYGVRLLVACGGPNIWVDTANNEVVGYWGCDEARALIDADAGDAITEAYADVLACRGLNVR